jgi:DNA-binding NtrC family response regulator
MPSTQKTVVILDDELAIRMVLESELTKHGFRAQAFEEKGEGYKWIVANHPDLIVSDVRSPGMDGFEFLDLMKANPMTADIPIVFATTHSNLAEAMKARKMGAVDLVTKPYDTEELIKTIEHVLSDNP